MATRRGGASRSTSKGGQAGPGRAARTLPAPGLTAAQYQARVAALMLERPLQNQILALAHRLGWRAYHTHDSRGSQAGYPDLTLVHPGQGRVIFAELKTSKGTPTPEQRAWLTDLTAAGQEAYLWRPADLLDRTVEGLLRHPPK